MPSPSSVVVHLSGDLSRQTGRSRLEVDTDSATITAAHLRSQVARQIPSAQELVERALVVAGDRILGSDEVVPADRRISLVPPVSGG